MNAEELSLWYWLSDIKGIGPVITRRLLKEFGDPSRVFESSKSDIVAKAKVREKLADEIVNSRDDVPNYVRLAKKQLQMAEMLNGRILTAIDSPYSELYNQNGEERALPPIIHAIGDVDCLITRRFAIVGTRRPSEVGKQNARRLAYNLVREGFSIVSGLALGIDEESHKGALEAGGKTIAILGCGAEVKYPPTNALLYDTIVKNGLILSEFPFGVRPSSGNLRKRNRTIVSLSEAIAIAECPIRSGAMIAARFAGQQRKPTFAFHYTGMIDNRGGEWLLSKSLATEVTDSVYSDVSRAIARYEVPAITSIDKLFLAIWPKKQETKRARKTTKLASDQRRGSKRSVNDVTGRPQNQGTFPLEGFPKIEIATENKSSFPFMVGDIVTHPTLGKGEITAVTPTVDDHRITVRFSNRDVRTLSWRYANLKKT